MGSSDGNNDPAAPRAAGAAIAQVDLDASVGARSGGKSKRQKIDEIGNAAKAGKAESGRDEDDYNENDDIDQEEYLDDDDRDDEDDEDDEDDVRSVDSESEGSLRDFVVADPDSNEDTADEAGEEGEGCGDPRTEIDVTNILSPRRKRTRRQPQRYEDEDKYALVFSDVPEHELRALCDEMSDEEGEAEEGVGGHRLSGDATGDEEDDAQDEEEEEWRPDEDEEDSDDSYDEDEAEDDDALDYESSD